MKIIQYPNPILLEKIDYITDFHASALKNAVESCLHFLQHDAEKTAIGVAANQLGFKHRFFVYCDKNIFHAIYNPRIISQSKVFEKDLEGCLSFEDEETGFPQYKIVYRPKSITVAYRENENDFIVKKLSGDLKNIFCHEIDHLNGLTYVNRLLPSSHVE